MSLRNSLALGFALLSVPGFAGEKLEILALRYANERVARIASLSMSAKDALGKGESVEVCAALARVDLSSDTLWSSFPLIEASLADRKKFQALVPNLKIDAARLSGTNELFETYCLEPVEDDGQWRKDIRKALDLNIQVVTEIHKNNPSLEESMNRPVP